MLTGPSFLDLAVLGYEVSNASLGIPSAIGVLSARSAGNVSDEPRTIIDKIASADAVVGNTPGADVPTQTTTTTAISGATSSQASIAALGLAMAALDR